jgi:Putative peptidoglycan binding domain
MSTDHVIEQGEHLSQLAKQYGFRDHLTIWDHPNNAELKEKRQNPNVLFPGDSVFIPDKEEKTLPLPTGQSHRFQLKGKPLMLRVVIRDFDHEPLANTKCTIQIDGKEEELTTDDQGMISLPIPKNAEEGLLVYENPLFPFPLSIPIKIGHLDPVEEITGQRARLNNLGYSAEPLESEDEDKFTMAVQEFQCDHELTVDGVCGPETQAKLKETYGC